MDPTIRQARELRQKLQADIAALLNDYTDATDLTINDLRLNDTIRGYGPSGYEVDLYVVSVEVKL